MMMNGSNLIGYVRSFARAAAHNSTQTRTKSDQKSEKRRNPGRARVDAREINTIGLIARGATAAVILSE